MILLTAANAAVNFCKKYIFFDNGHIYFIYSV